MTTIHTLVLIVHVIVGAMIIGLVLVQRGKGAETGAAFGSGASATVFGAKGSANFLSRSTAVLATLFFATSLGLAYLGSQRPVATSVVEQTGVPAAPQADAAKDSQASAPAEAAGAARRPGSGGWDARRHESGSLTTCRCGGIGRHAVLRGRWRKPCEFESRHRHHVSERMRRWRLEFARAGWFERIVSH